MNIPGKIEIQGAVKSCSLAVANMPPQLGVGGWVPKPKNDKEASINMAPDTPKVAITNIGPTIFGRIWVNIILNSL